MVNMGTENKLIACFDIKTQASRKDAVKSIFDMLALIVAEEEELLTEMIDQNAGDIYTGDIKHIISFLISAMDCLDNVYLDSDQNEREHEDEAEDEEFPF